MCTVKNTPGVPVCKGVSNTHYARKQEKYDEVLKGWKEDTKIKVVKKEWKKVDFKDQGITITTSKTSDTGSDSGSDAGSDAGADSGSN